MFVLLDWWRVMRGSKSGLEKLLTGKAPQLLDIDSDSCYQAHNAAKKFCAVFYSHVEQLLNDRHTDFKWNPEQRDRTSDSKIGTPVATPPGAWCYRDSAGTGQPSVSIL